MSYTVKEIAKSASRALGVLICKSKSVGGFSFDVFKTLYDNLVQPILSYGSAIWGTKEYGCINTIQNRACRFFLNVHSKTPNLSVRGDMGWTSTITKQRIEILRFWRRLHGTDPIRTLYTVSSWSRKVRKSWDVKVMSLISSWNLPISDLFNISQSEWEQSKDKLLLLDHQEWVLQLWNDKGQINGNKLRTYRMCKNILETENYVKTQIHRSYRSILAKLRCGTLPLEVETGRFARPKIPLKDRLCKLCNSGMVEDEVHFLTTCCFYSDLRYDFRKRIIANFPHFIQLPPVDQYVYIMTDHDLSFPLAKLVFQMFQRRRLHIQHSN